MPVPICEKPALFWPMNGPPALVGLDGPGPRDGATGRPTQIISTGRRNFVVDAAEVFDLTGIYPRFVPQIGTA